MRSPTRASWVAMKSRCYNKNLKDYKYWGGRGIIVCEDWLKSYESFLQDMGEKPVGTSLDRIDNNGNYEPSNCRWATKHQQMANRSNTGKTPGVSKVLYTSYWKASLKINKVWVLNKTFMSEQEAINARKKAEKDYNIVL